MIPALAAPASAQVPVVEIAAGWSSLKLSDRARIIPDELGRGCEKPLGGHTLNGPPGVEAYRSKPGVSLKSTSALSGESPFGTLRRVRRSA